jgi:hypothetical protein
MFTFFDYKLLHNISLKYLFNVILSFKENLEEVDYPKLRLKATSPSDVYGIVFDDWGNLEPFKVALEFGNKIDINFKETRQSSYPCDSETAPRSIYDCYAQLMSYSNSTTCQKNCISSRTSQGYLPLMKDLSMLKNCTPFEEFCVEKDATDSIIQYIGNKCPRPSNLTQYSADLEYKDYGFENDGILHLEIKYPSSYITVFEEYPIYDFSGMVGSVAGSFVLDFQSLMFFQE